MSRHNPDDHTLRQGLISNNTNRRVIADNYGALSETERLEYLRRIVDQCLEAEGGNPPNKEMFLLFKNMLQDPGNDPEVIAAVEDVVKKELDITFPGTPVDSIPPSDLQKAATTTIQKILIRDCVDRLPLDRRVKRVLRKKMEKDIMKDETTVLSQLFDSVMNQATISGESIDLNSIMNGGGSQTLDAFVMGALIDFVDEQESEIIEEVGGAFAEFLREGEDQVTISSDVTFAFLVATVGRLLGIFGAVFGALCFAISIVPFLLSVVMMIFTICTSPRMVESFIIWLFALEMSWMFLCSGLGMIFYPRAILGIPVSFVETNLRRKRLSRTLLVDLPREERIDLDWITDWIVMKFMYILKVSGVTSSIIHSLKQPTME